MGLIEGFLKGVFLAAGARAVGAVENKKRLNSCLMSEEVEGIPTFTYKGHIYNKARYIDLCVQSIQKLKKDMCVKA